MLFITASGYIELLELGSARTFHIIVISGVLLGIYLLHSLVRAPQSIFSRSINLNYKRILAISLAILFGAAYCVNMMFHAFNFGDDYSSYLIFPLRILSEGFSGGDAFNLRGIEHGLGGGDYINALFLSLIKLPKLYLAESGLGFVLLGLLCIDYAQYYKPGFWIKFCAFILAYITAIFAQYTNVTPILTGSAIGFGMLMIGQRLPSQFSPKLASLLGALCACLIILKGNLLAPALMFMGVIFLARLLNEKCRFSTLKEILIALLVMMVTLLPWMIASKSNHGTLFYPLLGKGFTYSGGFALVPLHLFLAATQEFFLSTASHSPT